MNTADKLQLKNLAAQLRECSQELNHITRTGTKYDLLIQSKIVQDIAGGIITVARK